MKRYDCEGMEDPYGEWVKHADASHMESKLYRLEGWFDGLAGEASRARPWVIRLLGMSHKKRTTDEADD